MTQEEATYTVNNMNKDEVQKLGRYRWRRERPRTVWTRLESLLFPIGLFYFMVSFAIPASGIGRTLLMLPIVPILGWLIWMTYRDIKANNRAGDDFLTNSCVRRNHSGDHQKEK